MTSDEGCHSRHALMSTLAFRWPWTALRSSKVVRARSTPRGTVFAAPELTPTADDRRAFDGIDSADDIEALRKTFQSPRPSRSTRGMCRWIRASPILLGSLGKEHLA